MPASPAPPAAIDEPAVAAAFAAVPDAVRDDLLALRAFVLQTAASTPGVASVEETVRWGQPSYASPVGTPVRLGAVRGSDDEYAVYVHCQTTLVATWRQMYPDLFRYEGRRAIRFRAGEPVAWDALGHCVAMALRYRVDPR